MTFTLDGHGSTRLLLDSTAAAIQQFAYDAYGVMLNAAALTTTLNAFTNHRYVGEHQNPLTGRIYLRRRWYDPSAGRFTRRDPITRVNIYDPISLHKHLYAHGNPIMGIDPSGLFLPGTYLETLEATSIGEEIDAELIAASSPAWVKATAIALSIGIVFSGGLVFMQNGSPISMNAAVLAHYLQQRAQLQQHLATVGQAHKQAVQNAVATGKYTQQQAQNLPIFFVYKTGANATPQIWQNDAEAMAGNGTKGGVSAPNVLNYGGPGTNKINRPLALAWAKSVGITATSGVTSLDEYPFASTLEGGAQAWLRVAPVPISEQKTQWRDLGSFYGAYSYKQFTFLVVLVP